MQQPLEVHGRASFKPLNDKALSFAPEQVLIICNCDGIGGKLHNITATMYRARPFNQIIKLDVLAMVLSFPVGFQKRE